LTWSRFQMRTLHRIRPRRTPSRRRFVNTMSSHQRVVSSLLLVHSYQRNGGLAPGHDNGGASSHYNRLMGTASQNSL
jgi:hypothetical protein